jgi:hypothetical protein
LANLWTKAEDLEEIKGEAVPKLLHESLENKSSKVDLEEPLLSLMFL